MAKRNRTCSLCGAGFEYEVRRGADRKYCGDRCAGKSLVEARARRVYAQCTVAGCGGQANRVSSGLCEKHYMRVRRHGSTDKLDGVKPGALEHSNGYRLVHLPGHPLRRGSGRIYEHRAVYYASHGEGPFDCHWCRQVVTWDDMHVDHVDGDRQNNDSNNLVASCALCNQRRGHDKMRETVRRKLGIEFRGRVQTVREWAAELGIGRTALRSRIEAGWSTERALTEPRGKFGPRRKPA